MQAVSISEARKRLFELRDQVVDNHEEVIVTHKRGNMVLMSLDDWEAYQETFRLLKDTAALKALFQSFEERDQGTVTGKTVDDVFFDLV
jgi:antitoxin YefM